MILLASENSNPVIFECRRCGTTLDRGASTCPACDSEAIAEYAIE
jgi:RNA polymerase subunit RPABC4/transcription elongation factor Spt4